VFKPNRSAKQHNPLCSSNDHSFQETAMLNKRIAVALAAVALISACATATPYQPANKRGEGYVDQKLEAGKYRVTFEGNSTTDRAVAENYVLYRAAEIALANGDDYFVLASQVADTRSTFNTTGFTNGGFGGFGRAGFFYGGGFGGFGGGYTTTTTRQQLAYTVGALITTHKGEKPADNAMAFNARSVIESIGPSLQRPKQ